MLHFSLLHHTAFITVINCSFYLWKTWMSSLDWGAFLLTKTLLPMSSSQAFRNCLITNFTCLHYINTAVNSLSVVICFEIYLQSLNFCFWLATASCFRISLYSMSYFQILFEVLTTYMVVLSCKLYPRWSLSNIISKYNHFMSFKHSNPTVAQFTSLCSFSCDCYRFDDNIGYFF